MITAATKTATTIALKIERYNTTLDKYLGFYQRMISTRDEFPDNADFNERVNTRITQITDTLTRAINEGFRATVRLRNGIEIIPKSIGGYYDFHFLTYIDESDTERMEWRDFDLEKVASFLVEPIESVIDLNPAKVNKNTPSYNLIINNYNGEEYDDHNFLENNTAGYQVTYSEDGTFDVVLPQENTHRDNGCNCTDCQEAYAQRLENRVPIENNMIIRQVLQDVFRTTYANDADFNDLLEIAQTYRRNR